MLAVARPLSPRAARRVGELAASIERYDDRPALASVVRELAPLVDGEGSAAYRVSPLASGWDLDFMYTAGLRRATVDRLDGFLRRAPRRWAWFDPLLPEPRQRNRPVVFSSLTTWEDFDRSAIAQQVFTPSGLGRHEQLRVLVCDGPLLLAWVGIFTRSPVGAREHAILRRLVAPLQRRLTLERCLGLGSVYALATHAALEALPSAAFLVRADGAVEHANAMGRALLSERPLDLAARLRGVALDRARPSPARGGWRMVATRLSVAGLPPYYLVVVREAAGALDERLAEVSAAWRLTPRQRRVVRELVRGESNKGIAERLGVGVSTVEYHLTTLLRKARVDNRVAFVAKFWGDGI